MYERVQMTELTPKRGQERFRADVLTNDNNRVILDRWDALALPDGWLVAGCLFQTVWNLQAGRDPAENIKDYDLFYFDGDDLSEAGERRYRRMLMKCSPTWRCLSRSPIRRESTSGTNHISAIHMRH
jgi:hypothetical protein